MGNRRTGHDLTFDEAVEGFLDMNGEITFLQVGGYDGVSYDPLRPHIVGGGLSGVIVEPLADNFAKLQALYGHSDRIRIENCAIAESDGERDLWRFQPEALRDGRLDAEFGGVSSLIMPKLLDEAGSLGGLFNETDRTTLRSLIVQTRVQCRTFKQIIVKHDLRQIDLLLIDTEGYDFELLKCFDLVKFRPAIVHFESMHLSPDDRRAAEDLLISLGYLVNSTREDSLAIRGLFGKTRPPPAAPLLSVAARLLAETRWTEALALYDHLLALDPANGEALGGSATALRVLGHVNDSLRRLIILKEKTDDLSTILPIIKEGVVQAIVAMNALLNQGRIVEAAAIADAIVTLVPREPDFLTTAMRIARHIGRWEQVVRHAASLLTIDPTCQAALDAIAEAAPRARGGD